MGFARVKDILDQAITTWQNAPGNDNPTDLSGHGPTFSWATKPALLAAVGHGARLIQPEVIGNGRGGQANLIIDLPTGLNGPASPMPQAGPFLPEIQIKDIE